ncbi:MAG: dihydropteroate synthase [Actinomycetes bacterium]|jgi:dihydropteroate synthase|nr:dihydropteroate synthase [Actinomycetes bacterium]
MGIVNVTPDSFSDGGHYATTERAVAHALEMVDAGASIIDIGGESTRPGAEPVSAAVETARVVPVIEKLQGQEFVGTPFGRSPIGVRLAARTDGQQPAAVRRKAVSANPVTISIDTYHPEVAKSAYLAGARMLNDISGFRDSALIALAAGTVADCVVMHMRDNPRHMQDDPHYDDVVVEVNDWLLERAAALEAAGVAPGRIVLDPGFGFGKTGGHNLQLLAAMPRLCTDWHARGYQVLVGVSRKRFIGDLFGIEEPLNRDEMSADIAAALAAAGADIVRVHNVAATVAALARQDQPPRDAYIALGSNQGDAWAHLQRATDLLRTIPLTGVDALATPVLTEPAYDEDQPPFANTVVRVSTQLSACALFAFLQAIEVQMGRVKTRVNGPRVIDVDLLDYEGLALRLPGLTLPHPRLEERAFVVEPLREIAPQLPLPSSDLLPYGRIIRRLDRLQ